MPPHNPPRPYPLQLALVWLLVAASRIQYLQDWRNLAGDELWAAWRSIGDIREIIAWTPIDWPPGSYLVIGGWQALVGHHPVALRMLPLLFFLLGLALLYRVVGQIFGRRAALLTVIVLAASGEGLYRTLFLRGHAFILSLLPLLLWLTLRHFNRPTWARGAVLGVALAGFLYLHPTVVFIYLALGLYTIIVRPRDVWLWWYPVAVLITLGLPEIIARGQIALGRTGANSTREAAFLADMATVYGSFAGRLPWLWAAIILVATVAVLWRGRSRTAWVFGAWALAPLLFWAFDDALKLFNARYMHLAWVGLAIWTGVGLSQLPQIASGAINVALLGVMLFAPLDRHDYESFLPYVGETAAWLADEMQWGDVVVLDPNLSGLGCDCREEEFWDFYARAYFPDGLPIRTEPGNARRVFFVSNQNNVDAATEAAVRAGRVGGAFIGPPTYFTRRYEAPPNPTGTLFENGMRFHGADIIGPDGAPTLAESPARLKGQTVTVRLWWSVDTSPDRDYSISLSLMNGDSTVAGSDSGPQTIIPADGPTATSAWEPNRFYIEERTLTVPDLGVTTTFYLDLNLTVYQWWDGLRLTAPGADTRDLLKVGEIVLRLF